MLFDFCVPYQKCIKKKESDIEKQRRCETSQNSTETAPGDHII